MEGSPKTPWWQEREFLLLFGIVLVLFFSRWTTLDIRGEETRRAQVAVEILESGNWIVPTQQNEIYTSRPPAGSWTIAVIGLLLGEVDLVAVRLPSILSILATTVLIYWYGRQFLSPLGCLSAGLAFSTGAQVLQLGQLGETDAQLTWWIASALLFWHAGYVQQKSPLRMWCLAYSLVAIAALVKGLQGPLFFGAAVGFFLLVRRDWKTLFSPWHFLGLGVMIAIVGAWQVAYYLQTNWESSWLIWMRLAKDRFELEGMLRHWLSFPLETLACLLPWSPFLLLFGWKPVRQAIEPRQRGYLLFLICALLATFPSMLLASGAVTRYYMPMYPCVALLIGCVIGCAPRVEATWFLARYWKTSLLSLAVAVVVGTTGFVALAIVPETIGSAFSLPAHFVPVFGQPLWFAGLSVVMTVPIVWGLYQIATRREEFSLKVGVVAIAMTIALLFNGAVINVQHARECRTGHWISQARERLPEDAQLVSLGVIHHRFNFFWKDEIPVVHQASEIPLHSEYFCFDLHLKRQKPLEPYDFEEAELFHLPKFPFEWELVGVVPCGRTWTMNPQPGIGIARVRGYSPKPGEQKFSTDRIGLIDDSAEKPIR